MTKKRRRKSDEPSPVAELHPNGGSGDAADDDAVAELAEEQVTQFHDSPIDEWITAPIPRHELESGAQDELRPLEDPGAAAEELSERAETRTSARQPLRSLYENDSAFDSTGSHLEDRFDFGSPTQEHPMLSSAPPPISPAETSDEEAELMQESETRAVELPSQDDAPPSGDAIDTPPDPGSADAGSPRLQSIVESLLFAADRPIGLRALADLVEEPELERVRAAVLAVEQSWRERGVQLHEVAGGYQFRTHPANAMWVQKLLQQKPVRLSRALLETLAIVSYRQPITRPEIDEIRGVDSGGTLKTLMDRSLVRILGKKEEPGRPLLYGTTKEFLEFFSLRDLKDLPTLREYHELSEEHQAQVAALEGVAPEGAIMAEGELAEDELPKLSRLEISAPREDAAELEEIDRLIRNAGTTISTDSDLPTEGNEEEIAVTGKFPSVASNTESAASDFDEERSRTSIYGDPLIDTKTDESEFQEQEEPTRFRGSGLDDSLIDGRDPDKEPSK